MDRTIKSLIRKADLDLTAAKVLYKKQDFSNALFLFQQAVEKAYKAGGLLTRQITIDDLTSVGHNFLKMLRLSLSTVTNNGISLTTDWWKELIQSDDNYSGDELRNINPADRQKFFRFNEDEIAEFISLINSFKRKIKKTLANPKGVSIILEIAKQSGKLSETEISNMETDDPDQIAISDTNQISELILQIFALQILGLITTAHSEQTRYPFTNKLDYSVKCPIEIYTLDMPIIKNLKRLFKLADKAILTLKTEMQKH